MTNEQNPHALPDGSPKPGETAQFFEWREKAYNDRLKKMSPEERKKELEAKEHMERKMQS